jgi:acetyl esterase
VLQYLDQPVLDDRCRSTSSLLVRRSPTFDRRAQLSMWDLYLSGAGATTELAAPARATEVAGLPPTLVLVADHDPMRDEALRYGRRLRRRGVVTETVLVKGTFHGFLGLREALLAQRTWTEVMQRIRTVLHPDGLDELP